MTPQGTRFIGQPDVGDNGRIIFRFVVSQFSLVTFRNPCQTP
jgi:hypothetical protein